MSRFHDSVPVERVTDDVQVIDVVRGRHGLGCCGDVKAIFKEPPLLGTRFRLVRGKGRALTLLDWIPAVGPVNSEPFLQCDRSIDPCRLSGILVNVTGVAPEDGLRRVARECARYSGAPDAMWLSALHEGLVQDLDGPTGLVRARFSEEIPPGEVFMLTSDIWGRLVWPDGSERLVCRAPGYNARGTGLHLRKAAA